jgi:hypothetical protein
VRGGLAGRGHGLPHGLDKGPRRLVVDAVEPLPQVVGRATGYPPGLLEAPRRPRDAPGDELERLQRRVVESPTDAIEALAIKRPGSSRTAVTGARPPMHSDNTATPHSQVREKV